MSEEENKEYLENIKNNLTIEQIESLVAELGGEPQINNKILKAKTICHCGNSHKLYYYDNTKLFKCYTDCADSFDIFDLVFKVKKSLNDKYVFPQAVEFVANYFGLPPQQNNFNTPVETLEDWKIFKKYDIINVVKDKEQIVEIKKYDDRILRFLPHPRITIWEDEGITREIMEDRGICYDPVNQGVIIPHYDIDNNLIGIRERTLIKENEQYGKYKPAILNNKMYNHPLGFNLYNLNNSKGNINILKKAIIFEGEKSCLLYASYFGKESDISVACCGSSLISYQVNLLLDLGVNEIIIAFDKQFKKVGDEEWERWTKKLDSFHSKYGASVQISYMFDKEEILEYKSSPIDEGIDKFNKLFKERITI